MKENRQKLINYIIEMYEDRKLSESEKELLTNFADFMIDNYDLEDAILNCCEEDKEYIFGRNNEENNTDYEDVKDIVSSMRDEQAKFLN